MATVEGVDSLFMTPLSIWDVDMGLFRYAFDLVLYMQLPDEHDKAVVDVA